MIKLRFIDVESSGLILSVKSYHPFRRGFIHPIFELPFDNITSIEIERKPFCTNLVLCIKSSERKVKKKIYITGIGQKKLELLTSLT